MFSHFEVTQSCSPGAFVVIFSTVAVNAIRWSVLSHLVQGCTPRPRGKWLPQGAPAPKMFKNAPPHPENAPGFNCYPALPRIFFPLPRPAPKQKKAAPCIPDRGVREGSSRFITTWLGQGDKKQHFPDMNSTNMCVSIPYLKMLQFY